ncbi:uncharacterized protein [Linepithema humile]|uniref:uncharacterized protein n=1 Tax=Linepithema humile TaxID=83485 RepID=UPI00351DAA5D
MKLVFALVTVLAIFGLGQAHQFPDFGKGPLHEDIQDFLDLIPVTEIAEVIVDYIEHDHEVKAIADYLRKDPSLIRNLWIEFQSVPELLNLLNYMQKEGVKIYEVINEVNRALNIKELVPPADTYSITTKRTGGLAGFFKDIKALFNYDDFISTYVNKMRHSKAFVNFINELKSDNFQRFVNKFYYKKSVQLVLAGLKRSGVNTRVVANIMYLVLGITVPDRPPKTVQEELMDFLALVPVQQFLDIILQYINEDEQVKNAYIYMFTPEFHTLIRSIEALKEHQALVVFVQKAGVNVIEAIQQFHRSIGMEEYVPPKIESLLTHKAGLQKIGDGMKGMLEDLYAVLPLDKIDALYKEKMMNSEVFAEFIAKMSSPEMQEIVTNLYNHPTYKDALMKTREKGLELEGLTKLASRIFGIKFPDMMLASF